MKQCSPLFDDLIDSTKLSSVRAFSLHQINGIMIMGLSLTPLWFFVVILVV